jgi:hypothetical protein
MRRTVPPLVQELFARLPKPGEEFPHTERLLWLRAAEAILALIYKDNSTTAGGPDAKP